LLSITHLKKRFGDRIAVDDVSFEVRAGETIGLLGPNGAGKTTTLSMLSGLTQPDGGSVSFGGELLHQDDAASLKRRVGLVPQDLALFDELSAWANLELFGGLYGIKGRAFAQRAEAALDLVGLSSRRADRVKQFSGGMKRRLNIAGALLHDPQLILLDEPTVGVDPQSRNAIFENLEELKRRGKTLVYTTHYMEEAERLCDRIVIIDHGRVIANDTVRGLYRLLPNSRSVELQFEGTSADDALLADLSSLTGVSGVARSGAGVRIETDDFSSGPGASARLPRGKGCARGVGADGAQHVGGCVHHAHWPWFARRTRPERPGPFMKLTAVWALIRNDLRIYATDRRAMIIGILVPILIAAFFGYVFGGNGNSEVAKIPIAIVDEDQSAISRAIAADLGQDSLVSVQALDRVAGGAPSQGRQDTGRGRHAGGILRRTPAARCTSIMNDPRSNC
jgi:ABC-2 type transport system ATP-binding protein